MAESMQAQFKWDSEDDWRNAGTRLHALEGLFTVEAGSRGPMSKEGVTLVSWYEAEQHLRQRETPIAAAGEVKLRAAGPA